MFVEKPPIMTVESLVSYGFKEFPVNQHEKFNRNWQYCKRDKKGKKLFITVRFWEFSRYSDDDRKVNDSFDAAVQFDINGSKTFNVNTSVNDMTPTQVVEWFERMFLVMGCSYYETYFDDLYDEEGVQTSFNCEECGKYLPPEEAIAPFLCPPCKYENDTGFRQAISF